MDKKNQNCPPDKYLSNVKLFEAFSLSTKAEWVFLGDGITNAGRWSELFPDYSVANRGIDGDTTLGIHGRLNSVIALSPKCVFLMSGINDLFQNRSIVEIMNHYRNIVTELIGHGINVVIQSTLLTRDSVCNAQVQKLNQALVEMAEQQEVRFVDLNSRFAPKGILLEHATFDGVHLQAEMYLEWRNVLKRHLV